MKQDRPRVIIVGGGPAGLVLAIELGRRAIPCVVFDRGSGTPNFPKANSTTSRTMEHYRRLGIAGEIRKVGLPDDFAPDISYHTRLTGWELARLHWPSRAEALSHRLQADPRWPTPEPMHRGQQMFIEPILKAYAASFASVDLRFGWEVSHVEEGEEGATATATEIATGRSETVSADYLVGCDGPRSLVRSTMGIRYEGFSAEEREFLGGRMLATYLRAPAVYGERGPQPSWQYWMLNAQRRGILVAIDGRGLFCMHTQLPPGKGQSMEYARETFELIAPGLPVEIIDIAEWTAGFTLVAERMSSKRLFLAGDAAHLFTPTAGLGYNTSVDDVCNLGWKLAALCKGWGGPGLLPSYQDERKPIAHRNTGFARELAEFFRELKLPPALEEEGENGDRARAVYAERLLSFARREFDAPGIILGAYYGGSAIVAVESGEPPPDHPNVYVADARPGRRAPHVWLEDGVALFDRFGREFTLLRLDGRPDDGTLEQAASELGVPLDVVRIDRTDIAELYGASQVLIRPDQHVAWRGSALSAAGAKALMRQVVGLAAAG